MKYWMRRTPRDFRKMDRNQLISHVESRVATILKRGISGWNERNASAGRPSAVDFSQIDTENLIMLASALTKARADWELKKR